MNVKFFLLLGGTVWLLQGCAHHNKVRQSFIGCDESYKVSPYSLESLDQKNRCKMYSKGNQ